MKSISNHKGFSFYELMVAIAIIAVISAIAIPNLIGWRAETKFRGAVNNLKGDLNIARMTAVKENVAVVVQFYSDRYEIYLDNDGDWNLDSGERRIRNRVLPAGVSIDLGATDFTSDRTRFNTRGLPSNTGTVVLSNANGTQSLNLNMLGRISVN